MKKIFNYFLFLILLGASSYAENNAYNKIMNDANQIMKKWCFEDKKGDACDAIGLYYLEGKNGFKQNYKKAFEYFKRACDLGSAEGCNNFGFFYGTGTGHVVKKNIVIAIKYYEKACDKNYKPACKNLGAINFNKGLYFYNHGKELYAIVYFHKACLKYNLPQGCFNAGYISYKNRISVNKELIKKYFKKGCDLGYQKSCEFLKNHKDL